MCDKEESKDYQKFISEGIVQDATMTASLGIGQLYSKTTFTHPSENEDEVVTIKGLDDSSIVEAIRKQEKLLENGDVSSLENMLLSQTHVLNAVLSNMVGHMSGADTLKKLETYGRLALKAQSQTRQTISTLAEVKGIKKTTFIHQLNNAQNQQVNNGAPEKLNKSSNEKVINEVDSRNETERTRPDQSDETLALPENTGGISTLSPERIEARDAVSTDKRAAKTVS